MENTKQYIKDEELRTCVNKLIKKVKHNYFNIIIVWGPTRTGKSTLGRQIAKTMADGLKVSFNAKNNIWFSAKELLEQGQKGIKHEVNMLDEAAFQGKGIDWQNKDQQNLLKLFDVAAKYNQTYILIIPHLEELKYNFIRNAHTVGVQVSYNADTLERGYFKMYNKINLLRKYDSYVKKLFIESDRVEGSHAGRFDDNDAIDDMDEYERKKDLAIQELGKDKDDGKVGIRESKFRDSCKNMIEFLMMRGYKPHEIMKEANIPHTTFKNLVKELKEINGPDSG